MQILFTDYLQELIGRKTFLVSYFLAVDQPNEEDNEVNNTKTDKKVQPWTHGTLCKTNK